jgi:peptidoglycan/xylan/chitin deacetylase (PgdA/CDA1 family)
MDAAGARLLFAATLLLPCLLPLDSEAAVVLQYHHVSDDTPASTSVSPARFEWHLEYIADQGFRVVPLQTLVDALSAGETFPDRVVAITFDDGYLSIHETAFPLLKRRGWPFTVFVNSEPHDRGQAGFMSWEQLRELARSGGTIANHTASHPHLLDRRDGQNEADWREWVESELSGAARRIEQEIGIASRLFAYPYGEFDEALLEIVAGLGYTGFGQQSGPLASHSDPRALPRFPMGGIYGDTEDFAVKVNSLPMPLVETETVAGGIRPVWRLRPAPPLQASDLSCFASGQGRIPVTIDGEWALVQAPRTLPVGRSRYNCTAPSGDRERFYWESRAWIVRPAETERLESAD